MQEIKLNDIADSLIIFNKITFDRILKSETPSDSIALYTFYYYTAKWQGTNQPKCTTAYVANGLKWSESRVRKAKKELLDIGLVEDITSKDESGKIIGHFVKVNYFSLSTLKETHTIENPQCGIHDTVEKLETNALKEYIKCLKKEIEMLKNNNLSEREEKENFDIINEYKKICVSLPQTITLSPLLKSNIKTIENKYSFDKIKKVFKKAEASDFLKGSKGFKANFDWLMKDSNFAKVLDGNYDNKQAAKSAYDLSVAEKMMLEEM
ncbi:hypothetical protein [Ruminococcus sp.]|uniref:hypothetical protein n=1 Tax=Ruminococcus sp. TaxID=41978 RepID=UPI002638C796|nr:hypothetical protein [Ruminococcus sp.]MDD6990139.1 hypothetical protein [Ruminococcus sp.]MDY6202902.1 hypothetical protein [Ruminococcus sp.]